MRAKISRTNKQNGLPTGKIRNSESCKCALEEVEQGELESSNILEAQFKPREGFGCGATSEACTARRRASNQCRNLIGLHNLEALFRY